MSSPLDNLTSLGGGGGNQQKNTSPKKKKRIRINPIVKKMKGLLAYTIGVIGVFGVFYYYMSPDGTEYSLSNFTELKPQIEQMEKDIVNTIPQIEQVKVDVANQRSLVDTALSEMDGADKMVSPLEQGYYFIAYFDSLVKKHNITIKDFYVGVQSIETGNIDQLNVQGNDTGVALDLNSDYRLLPIKVNMTSSFDSLTLLFSEFYTKRLVYDKNLKITNNLDGTVTADMIIEFGNEVKLNTDPLTNSTPTETPTENTGEVTTDPNAPTGLDGSSVPENYNPFDASQVMGNDSTDGTVEASTEQSTNNE